MNTLRHDPDGAFDVVDQAVLDDLARVAETVDPTPAGLAERSLFAVTLDALETEVMGLQEIAFAGARSDRPVVEARTITFTAESCTVMIALALTAESRVRIDGWVAPAALFDVELRRPGQELVVQTDEDGRFVFEAVDRGPASLVIRPLPDGSAVSTPIIEL